MKDWIVRTPPYPNSTYALADPALAQHPMTLVNLFAMFRYANWMHNGQPTASSDTTTTEDGAYTLLGQNPPWVQRNSGARYFLPNGGTRPPSTTPTTRPTRASRGARRCLADSALGSPPARRTRTSAHTPGLRT